MAFFSRITNQMLFDNSLFNIQNQQKEIETLQTQLATGKQRRFASEDPIVATQSLRLNATLTENRQFQKNIVTARRTMEITDSSLDNVLTLLKRARVLTIQAANDSLVTSDRAMIGNEVNQLLENLVELGNTEIDNKYIFGGAETTSKPFQVTRGTNNEITNVTYQGDTNALTKEIDLFTRFQINLVGSETFQAINHDVTGGTMVAPINNAARELANYIVPGGGMEGFIEIDGEKISYDLDGNPTTATGDSLVDIMNRINNKNLSVRASIKGTLEAPNAPTTIADQNAALNTFGTISSGSFSLNGVNISVDVATDSLQDAVNAVNAVTQQTGVTASIRQAGAADFRLVLDGPVSIVDGSTAATTFLKETGLINAGTSPNNIPAGNVTTPYQLRMTTTEPHQMRLKDVAGGTLFKELQIVDGSNNPPENIDTTAANTDISIFDALIQSRDDMRSGDRNALSTTDLTNITGALDQILSERSTTGSRLNRLEATESKLKDFELFTQELLSENDDIDVAKVISDFQKAQFTLQAALRATAKIIQPTLMDFL